ncbi:MAG: sensor histidine kinase [Hyphomicrobium sp.]|nr:sensor histidine kinase [Hyphomicrobium sp.]
MTFESERFPPLGGLDDWMSKAGRRIASALRRLQPRRIARRLSRFRLFQLTSASLVRRILIANLAGLVIMIGGILYFNQYHEWLVDAKKESLRTQGELIAAAIACDARVEKGGNIEIDLDKSGGAFQVPFRDDGFAALQLSINPARVTPILRRLIQHTKNRARIYGRDGTPIVDSAEFLVRGQLTRPAAAEPDKKPKTKNFWTRLTSFVIDEHLPVYREIGNAKGTAYPEVRAALAGTPTPLLLLNEDGEQIVSMAVPIRRANAILGALLLSTKPGEIDRTLMRERQRILTLAAIALIATIISSLVLARTVAGPIRRLSEAAELVSRNISARQDLPDYSDRNDEVGQLAKAFRAMTAALYRRIEASESFAADVAHELKNPLTAARSTAESLVYAKTLEQRDELVRQIQNELKRLNRLITDVSNASRLDAELARQAMKPTSVTSVIESVALIFRDILSEDTRKVRIDAEPTRDPLAFMVNGDEGRLGQVVTNLIDNAVSFSPPESEVVVRLSHSPTHVDIMIDDSGPGIPDDRLAIIFDRFYTDRPQSEALRGKNSGLGLSISREIIRAHEGEIWAENRRRSGAGPETPPDGARFVVRLPRLQTTQRGGSAGGRRFG